MKTFQKVIKYLAMAFAVFLIVSIIGGIIGAVSLFGGIFDGDAVLDDAKTYDVSNDITKLDIEIAAADFTIKTADSFSVKSNLKNITVDDKNGVLEIKEKKRFGVNYNNAVLTLYIPEGTVFEKIEIETGAGRFTVEELLADDLQLELGAGEVKIASLTANKKGDIDGGAGRISIESGTLNNLDLDMGVGQLNLTAAVLGNSDFDLGVGETNITLLGSEDDYSIKAEKGIGSISINGKTISHFRGTGNGENNIEVSGGIGAINIYFKTDTGDKK